MALLAAKGPQVGQATQAAIERLGGSLAEAVGHVNAMCKNLDAAAAARLDETDVVHRMVADNVQFALKDLGGQD